MTDFEPIISERTLQVMAKAIRHGIHDGLSNRALAIEALRAFVDSATAADWGRLEKLKETL